jgi:hypothetical protein
MGDGRAMRLLSYGCLIAETSYTRETVMSEQSQNLSQQMPQRGVDLDAAAPGGRPGHQTGGDWDNHRPSPEELAEHLGGMQFPISKADLVQNIRWQKAPLPVIYFVEKLPEREYQSADEITQAVASL